MVRGLPRREPRGAARSRRARRALLATIALGTLVSALLTGCATSQPAAQMRASPAGQAARRPVTETAFSTAATASAASAPRPLAGRVVGIDPGHNGRNYADPAYIDHLVWNGRERESCDTTGTETDGGYTEARFNFNVARYLAADARALGASVVLTRTSNAGVGPCVDQRSEILNRAHADVAIDIHADGGPPGGRGFTILEPLADGANDRVIASSARLGRDLREHFRALTGMPESTYDGRQAISLRNNLAGLNLTTVPKVLIECGNMRNGADASLLVRSSFQRRAAAAIADTLVEFLTRG